MRLTIQELNVVLEAVARAEAGDVDEAIWPDPDKYVKLISSAKAKLADDVRRREAKSNARAIARQQKKNADRVDGYDRDDLGESPDY